MTIKCSAGLNGMKGRIEFNNSDIILEDEWKHKWEHSPITYRLNNTTTDIEKQSVQNRAVTVAFRTWQLRIKDIKFKRIYDPEVHVDINIWFRPLEFFDGRKGVLAHAYYPGQGEVSGDIEINDEWNWVSDSRLQTLSKPPLTSVLIHEIGHSLGLKHDTRTMDCMMYPSLDLGKRKDYLHENDIERIQAKYGKRNISSRFINYFRNRITKGYDFD